MNWNAKKKEIYIILDEGNKQDVDFDFSNKLKWEYTNICEGINYEISKNQI